MCGSEGEGHMCGSDGEGGHEWKCVCGGGGHMCVGVHPW